MREYLSKERQPYVVNNMAMVTDIVRRYIKPRQMDYEDCIQQGYLFLTIAAIRFDPGLGFKFSTFAYPYIIGGIKKYLRDQQGQGKLPRKYHDLVPKIIRLRNDGFSDNEIIEELGINSYDLYLVDSYNTTMSLDMRLDNGETEKSTLGDLVAAPENKETTDLSFSELDIALEMTFREDNTSQVNRDIYEEWAYSVMFDDKASQIYLANKYKRSQAHISRVISKLNKILYKYLYT